MLSEILTVIERTTLREFIGDLVGIFAFALIAIFGIFVMGCVLCSATTV